MCQVENENGISTKEIEIKIITKPRLKENYDRLYSVRLNDPFETDCPMKGEINSDYEVTWFKVS